jgi:hypothetical protein
MSCQNGACKCGFLQSSSHGCKKDNDCDCKLNWKLVALAAGGALLGLVLLIWGLMEQSKAHREGAELNRLIRMAAGAAG